MHWSLIDLLAMLGHVKRKSMVQGVIHVVCLVPLVTPTVAVAP
jgi:hypothetical protein